MQVPAPAALDEVDQGALPPRVPRPEGHRAVAAELDGDEGLDDGKGKARKDVRPHLAAGALVEHPLHLAVSVYLQGRGQAAGVLVAAQHEIVRVKVVHVAVGDEQVAQFGKIDAEPQRMAIGVGRKIDAQNAVHQNLGAGSELPLPAPPRLAAHLAVAKFGGHPFRGAPSPKISAS